MGGGQRWPSPTFLEREARSGQGARRAYGDLRHTAEEIRFTKQHRWQATNYVILVDAAVYAAGTIDTLLPSGQMAQLYRTRFPGHTFVLCRLA